MRLRTRVQPACPGGMDKNAVKGPYVFANAEGELCLRLENGSQADISLDAPFSLARIDAMHVLESEGFDVGPGETRRIAVCHHIHNGTPERASHDVLADLERCLLQWSDWLAGGIHLDGVEDLRTRDIMEGTLILIKMQQGMDGGIMATPRTYYLSYIRDNCSSLRGMMAAGHYEEARRFILRTEDAFQKLKAKGIFPIPSAVGIGNETFFPGFGDETNWIAETPALYVLIARMYFETTGDLDTLRSVRESLDFAMCVQLKSAAAHGWKLPFNGDETDSGGAGIQLADKPGAWSMPSAALCACALAFYIDYLKQIGSTDGLDGYEDQLSSLKNSMDENFWRNDLSIYDWYRGENMEWPALRLTNYHMFPLYWRTPLRFPEQAAESALHMKKHFNADRFLPIQPGGANEDFCGHTMGYLLYALAELGDPAAREVYEALVWGGTVGCWGTWCEAYHSNGLSYGPGETWDGKMHNMRPFESGANVDAILRYLGVHRW